MGKRKRNQGDGTLRLRKDGRWEGRVVIGYDEKGLPITKNVTAKTKRECVEKLEALKQSLGKAPSKASPKMPFGEWMDFWYQNYCKPGLRFTTQATYEERIYKQIIPKIGETPLDEITPGTLEKFYAHLKSDGRLTRREIYGNGLSNGVIRSIHAHIRAALAKAVSEKLIRSNPAELCRLPPKKSPEIKTLTPEEMQKLLIQAKEEGFYEMFLLDLSTGLRRGEILALQWDDINFETRMLTVSKQIKYVGGKLHIIPPKTKAADRSIKLPVPLIEVLKEYRKTVNSKWLFPSPVKEEDVPRDPTACRKRLSKILERAGCKHVSFHALRHTFATQSLRYGMDVKTLAATIGHTSVETTLNVYSHATEEMQRAAANKIEQTIGAVTGVQATCADSDSGDTNTQANTPQAEFKPYTGKKRKPGTGYIKQLSANCWQGRYSPTVNGERVARNIYAETEAECEAKLAELISEMKAELGRV